MFNAAFRSYGLKGAIEYAENDPARFRAIADDMIGRGVRVLITVNIDAATGRAVYQRAHDAGVKTIDYERLTPSADADYLVTFDNVEAGRQLGRGLLKCLSDRKARNAVIAEVNGSASDFTATALEKGYGSVLQPEYDAARHTAGPRQRIDAWSVPVAGTVFEEMLKMQPAIRGVLVANDEMAQAVIKTLQQQGLNGKVPVTGQGASRQGLRNVLAGDQCLTVYKSVRAEANAAVKLAAAIVNGSTPPTDGITKDTESGRNIPSIELAPKAIFASDVAYVVAEGQVSRAELCVGVLARVCTARGI